MDATDRAFSEVLTRARQGNADAFGQLVRPLLPRLRWSAERALQSRFQAKGDGGDLVQETLLQAWARFSQFRGSTPDEWKSWLLRILSGKITDFLRRQFAQCRDALREAGQGEAGQGEAGRADAPTGQGLTAQLPAEHTSPSQKAVRNEEHAALWDALAELPPAERELFLAAKVEAVSVEELAELYERSPGAIRGFLHRLRDKLRGKLRGKLGGKLGGLLRKPK